jgi:hypothetical protein
MTVTAIPVVVGTPQLNFTGFGNGIVTASAKRPLDGLVLENSFSENLLILCTSDSYTGGSTAGNEGMTVTGVGSQGDSFAFNWPLGSNARKGINAIDGDASNSSNNLLTNSGFGKWTSGVPNNFTIDVGAGTISQNAAIIYSAGSSLQITGDGATKTQFKQQFNNSLGTVAQLQSLTQFSVNLFMRRDGIAAGAGTLVVELVDGNGTVILDANSVPNSFSIDLSSTGPLSTQWTAFNGVFRTPEIWPPSTGYFLRFRESAALTSGRAVYLDKVSCGVMTAIYVSGPFVAVHAGAVPFASGDYATITISNSRGAGGTLSTFQTLWDQLLGMRSNDLLLPSSSSPTISDTLIG